MDTTSTISSGPKNNTRSLNTLNRVHVDYSLLDTAINRRIWVIQPHHRSHPYVQTTRTKLLCHLLHRMGAHRMANMPNPMGSNHHLPRRRSRSRRCGNRRARRHDRNHHAHPRCSPHDHRIHPSSITMNPVPSKKVVGRFNRLSCDSRV